MQSVGLQPAKLNQFIADIALCCKSTHADA
jgi:hypothetical protein